MTPLDLNSVNINSTVTYSLNGAKSIYLEKHEGREDGILLSGEFDNGNTYAFDKDSLPWLKLVD